MATQYPTYPLSDQKPKFPMFGNYFNRGLLACLLATWPLVACSTTHEQAQSPVDSGTAISTTDEQIFVGDTVEMSYDPNVIMKRAESYFEKESYAEAIVEYKHFLDLHRNHVLAPYAQFKIGVSHFKQFRTVDRDPEPLTQAITSYNKLLEEFPGNRYQAEAQQTIHTCRELLAQRHLMVGEFYLKRRSYLAAAHRFEKIIQEYSELDAAGEAMYQLAETYQNLGIEEWSQDWLVALINQYPNHSYHSKAQNRLASLQAEHPQLVAALSKSETKTEPPTPQLLAKGEIPQETTFSTPAHAGRAPDTDQSQVTASSPVHQPTPPTTSCAIGNWCGSDRDISKPIPVSHSIPPPASQETRVCKTGEWC
ncbi:MAG: outer membrane protein assembly factor BamD [Nitrospirales bacterium]|nr:outer membrane protein assembly factor BamD [Nitrospirales bacterium]